MEQGEANNNQYFVSMTDMLLGLLIIFLIIVAYLVISFSQSLEKARAADDAVRRATVAEQRAQEAIQASKLANSAAVKANIRAEMAIQASKLANSSAAKANIRAEMAIQASKLANSSAAKANVRADEAEKRADELQNILLSIDQTRIKILKQIKVRLAGANFDVEIDEKTGVIRLPEAELFETARFDLTVKGQQNILLLRKALEDILPCYSSSKFMTKLKRSLKCKKLGKNYVDAFFVEGHADRQPVKSNNLFKDNQELSTKRAMNAYNLLFKSEMLSTLTNSNDEYIMSVSGYGSNRPLCTESTKSCFAKNRRIDLRLVMEIPRVFPE